MRDKPQTGRKSLQKTSHKELLSMILKELLKLNNRKTTNPDKKWVKDLTDSSPEEIYRWKINIGDIQHHVLLVNYKLKQWDTIPHLLEWIKFNTLTIPDANKDVGKFSFVASENSKVMQPLWKTTGKFLTESTIDL